MDLTEPLRARGRGSGAVALAVGFDFDHTLGIDNKLERVAFLRVLELAWHAGGRALGTIDEEIVAIDALLEEQRAGSFSIDDAVRRFLSDRSVAEPDRYVGVYKRIALAAVERFVIPQFGVCAILETLRERAIPVAILTNGWAPLQQAKARCIGFDGPVVVSSEIGAQKPAREAFDALARALGCRNDAVVYVGDNARDDIAGALAAGMRGVWLNTDGRAYPAGLPAPGATIRELAELASLV